jgi:prolyl oligopeptidase
MHAESVDRRTLLLGASALGLVACASKPMAAPAPAAPAAPAGPPVARVAPVTETLWGQEIVDRYRWMENAEDADFEPWMRAEAAYARARLDAIPGLAAMKARVAGLSGNVAFIGRVQRAGARIIYEFRPVGADQFKLYVRDGEGPERVLIDPTTMSEGQAHVSLDWWLASPDGSHIVYGLSPAGSENSVTHVMEVASGTVLPERIDRTQYANPSWLPDGSGFFFNRLAEGVAQDSEDYYKNSVCWLHKIGTEPASDLRVLSRGHDSAVDIAEIDFPIVGATLGARYVVGVIVSGVQNEVALYAARLTDVAVGRARWRRVCTADDKVVNLAQRGDDLYLVTYKDAPRYKVVKTSAAAPDLAHARVVVPESARVVVNVRGAADGIYVQDLDGGIGRVRKIGAGDRVSEIALPFEGAVGGIATADDKTGCDITLESWMQPPTLFHYDSAANALADTGLQPQPALDISAYESKEIMAPAADGVQIPLSIVYRKDIVLNGQNPAIVDAYGSYGITSDPVFLPRTLAFLEQGGVLATAHVRGGGEFGRAWHEAGRKANKPNTWRDLIACCEELIRLGYTSKQKLAIQGGSAGGITVGRAMTERPDLFAAVIDNVGASNTLRSEFSPNGPPNIPEFGTVTDEQGFHDLYAMDSYQHVVDATAYPAVMLTTGMNDPRVAPWEVGKMTARLQAASNSGRPVLLRIDFDAGHGLGSTRAQRDAEVADEYAFVLWQAGAPGFQLS